MDGGSQSRRAGHRRGVEAGGFVQTLHGLQQISLGIRYIRWRFAAGPWMRERWRCRSPSIVGSHEINHLRHHPHLIDDDLLLMFVCAVVHLSDALIRRDAVVSCVWRSRRAINRKISNHSIAKQTRCQIINNNKFPAGRISILAGGACRAATSPSA